ncbi:C6 finger domain-containing protein [Botrytis cinerea]
MPEQCKFPSGSSSNSCDQCFRTKQSCSKHPLQCQRCAELESSCTYSFGKFMGRPKRNFKSRRQLQNETKSGPDQLDTLTNDDHSNIALEGPERMQNLTILPASMTSDGKFNSLETEVESSDWWQYSREDKETINYSFSVDDVENSSAKRDRSQQTAPKKATKTSACDQCYRFKVKCTREPDCCQRCSLSGNSCTYSAAIDLERSRKRSAPPSTEAPKKKMSFSSQTKPVQTMDDVGSSSITADSNCNEIENFCPKDLVTMQPQSKQQKHYRSVSAPEIPSSCQPISALHEPTHVIDECDISFHESSHYYSDSLLSMPPLDIFFDNENPAHDINFNIGGDESHEQSHGDEVPAKQNNLDHILVDRISGGCNCLQSALLSLSNLHAVVCGNNHSSLDGIFAAARNGLFICETLTLAQCSSCELSSTSTLLMLCVAILQQVYNAYELLANPAGLSTEGLHAADKKMTLSIKIGDMEFTDIGHNPSILNAILKTEKAKAERICVELEKTVTNAQSRDATGVGKRKLWCAMDWLA